MVMILKLARSPSAPTLAGIRISMTSYVTQIPKPTQVPTNWHLPGQGPGPRGSDAAGGFPLSVAASGVEILRCPWYLWFPALSPAEGAGPPSFCFFGKILCWLLAGQGQGALEFPDGLQLKVEIEL